MILAHFIAVAICLRSDLRLFGECLKLPGP
jgi:hypothetical protein